MFKAPFQCKPTRFTQRRFGNCTSEANPKDSAGSSQSTSSGALSPVISRSLAANGVADTDCARALVAARPPLGQEHHRRADRGLGDDLSDYRLAPGEVGVFMVIAADRKQARVIKRYIAGLLRAVSVLKVLIDHETADAIRLTNGLVIEILACSFRSLRGYTCIGAAVDEVSFWTDRGQREPGHRGADRAARGDGVDPGGDARRRDDALCEAWRSGADLGSVSRPGRQRVGVMAAVAGINDRAHRPRVLAVSVFKKLEDPNPTLEKLRVKLSELEHSVGARPLISQGEATVGQTRKGA